jgi:hypothetical protein
VPEKSKHRRCHSFGEEEVFIWINAHTPIFILLVLWAAHVMWSILCKYLPQTKGHMAGGVWLVRSRWKYVMTKFVVT